jgi:hypothetical protein
LEIPKNVTDFVPADADLASRGVSVSAMVLSRLDRNRIHPSTCSSEVSPLNFSRFVQDGKVGAGTETKAAFASAGRVVELDPTTLIDFAVRLSYS